MTRATRAGLALLMVGVGLTGDLAAEPEHLLQATNAPAPTSPAACFDAPSDAERPITWMVFTAPGCAPCHRWLKALDEGGAELARRGVGVRHYVTGVDTCLDAARVAGRYRGRFPLGVSDARSSARWGVHSTPTTVIVRDGRAVGVVVGVVPLSRALSLSERGVTRAPPPRPRP
ncbi:MAG: hypothetical protein CMH57_09880 [Myxococcales bacterium]|nr:hypothetical protein [Myxococcales bacterium]